MKPKIYHSKTYNCYNCRCLILIRVCCLIKCWRKKINLPKTYYNGHWSKCFSTISLSSWYQHLTGISAGCRISTILFLTPVNVAIQFLLAETNIMQCYQTLPLKAFMDDLFLKWKKCWWAINSIRPAYFCIAMGKDVFKGIKIKNFGSNRRKVVHEAKGDISTT